MKKTYNIFVYALFIVALNYACADYDTPAEITDDGGKQPGISTKIRRF